MQDLKTSLTATLAWVGWGLGGVLLAAGVLSARCWLGQVGLAACCAGAVLHVRTFFCAQAQHLTNAFELGRDRGRFEAQEVPVQRIR